ncbi:unnamed protein product [Merluccius merluccius]
MERSERPTEKKDSGYRSGEGNTDTGGLWEDAAFPIQAIDRAAELKVRSPGPQDGAHEEEGSMAPMLPTHLTFDLWRRAPPGPWSTKTLFHQDPGLPGPWSTKTSSTKTLVYQSLVYQDPEGNDPVLREGLTSSDRTNGPVQPRRPTLRSSVAAAAFTPNHWTRPVQGPDPSPDRSPVQGPVRTLHSIAGSPRAV